MSRVYDSWERLVAAVLDKEKLKQLALFESFDSSISDGFSSHEDVFATLSESCSFKRIISEWQKVGLLGRGSFGPVYEGLEDGGYFFAAKELSLLDQDDEGKQRILQLEQNIAFLSQFEQGNIVQYYSTKKDESKLYIFLELVRKGSLLSLYQNYTLRDSLVWSYTRHILHELKYLHDRNVVHGNIKCANILVDTDASVKLADFGLNEVKSCKGNPYWMAQMAALFRIGRGERPVIPESVSNEARDFILKCLQVDPSLRPTAAELLDHPFAVRPLLGNQ